VCNSRSVAHDVAYCRRSGGLIDNKIIVLTLRDLVDDFSAAGRSLLASGGCSLVFWLGKGMINFTMAARNMAEAWLLTRAHDLFLGRLGLKSRRSTNAKVAL
jgi:hypothetical protein